MPFYTTKTARFRRPIEAANMEQNFGTKKANFVSGLGLFATPTLSQESSFRSRLTIV
jgi:hypothetical protein